MATSKHTIRADFALGFGRGVKAFGSQVKWPDYDTMHQVVQYSDGQERRYKLKQRIVDKSGDVAPFAMYYDEIFKEWLGSDVATATLLAHDEPAISKKPAARVAKKKPAAKDEAEDQEEDTEMEEEEGDGERDDIDDSAPCAAAGPKAAKASQQYAILYYKTSH